MFKSKSNPTVNDETTGLPCICGTTICLSHEKGALCDAGTSTCSRPARCSKSDGSEANSARDCACGDTDCTSATGFFCHAARSQCSHSSYFDYGHVMVSDGHCPDKVGQQWVERSEHCFPLWKKLKELDGVDSLETTTDEQIPRGCFLRSESSKLMFNEKNASVANCSAAYSCVCRLTASNCAVTDGSAPNDAPDMAAFACICGAAACSKTRRVCDLSKNSCFQCFQGWWDDGDRCEACSAGKWSDQTGLVADYQCNGRCSAGKWSASTGLTSDAQCKLCPAGRWSNNTGASSEADCTICPSAKYSVSPGSTSIHDCDSGCPPGTIIGKTSGTDCLVCPAGRYQPNIPGVLTSCEDCPRGRFVADDGGSSFLHEICAVCPKGTKANREDGGASRCEICAAGRYADQTEQTTCISCAAGKHLPDPALDANNHNDEKWCTDCKDGKHSNAGEQFCEACKAGERARLDASTGTTFCEACDPGKFRVATASAMRVGLKGGANEESNCNECPRGFYQNFSGQPFCLPCIPGRANSLPGQESCMDCTMNTYAAKPEAETCNACPAGYGTGNASAACNECPAGKAGIGVEGGRCNQCPKGQYRSSTMNSSSCTKCPEGYHQDTEGQASCLPCIPGTSNDLLGQENCTRCQPGRMASLSASERCDVCEAGTFSKSGQSGCTPCPPQSDSLAGAISDRDCACRAGHFGVVDGEDGRRTCMQCPPRSTTLKADAMGPESCVCSDGFWKPSAAALECVVCPEHATCSSENDKPVTRPGFWRVPWRNDTVDGSGPAKRLPCLDSRACMAGGTGTAGARPRNDSAKEGCTELHGGPLCAACDGNAYQEAGSYLCFPCDEQEGVSTVLIVLVVCCGLGAILAVTAATVSDGGEASPVDIMVLKIAWNSAIISAGATEFPLAWPPVIVSMFQTYAMVSGSAMGEAFSGDCIVRTELLRPVQAWSVVIVTSVPASVLLWVFLFHTLRCLCRRRSAAAASPSSTFVRVHLPVATLVTLLMSHPVATKSALRLIACRPVAGRSYLDADFNIDCTSDEYWQWALGLGVPTLIVFTVGIPCAYGIAMLRHVRKGNLDSEREVYGFLFSGFRKEFYFFELWNTLRKALFAAGAVLFRPYGVSMQTWAALLVLVIFVAVFAHSLPYELAWLNELERTALALNMVTLLMGMGLFTNEKLGENSSQSFAVTITVVILLLNVIFLVHVVMALVRRGEFCLACRRKSGCGSSTSVAAAPASLSTEMTMTAEQRHIILKSAAVRATNSSKIGPRRLSQVGRMGTIKGSLRYNVRMACHLDQALHNQRSHEETRAGKKRNVIRQQSQARSRLVHRLQSRNRSRVHIRPKPLQKSEVEIAGDARSQMLRMKSLRQLPPETVLSRKTLRKILSKTHATDEQIPALIHSISVSAGVKDGGTLTVEGLLKWIDTT